MLCCRPAVVSGNAHLSIATGGWPTVGAARYMSPELFEQNVVDLHMVDVYAYAIVLWQLLSRGGVPFDEVARGDYRAIRDAVGRCGERPDVDAVVVPSTDDAMRRALRQLLLDAWKVQPTARPSFVAIVDVLQPSAAVLQMRSEV